ncbi:MAG: hypothetical protein J2P54_05080 [Bradyrhizobiaceae bacterium]|nr:hypothetical protein [Bradyrhizobiaceae bacterium]
MMVDIVTPQELADAHQTMENVAAPAKPEQTAILPPIATPPQQPHPSRDQAPLQQQSVLPPQAPPTQTAASPEQALPDPSQVAALLNLSMQVANPDLNGPPTDSAAKLSADEIAAFKEHLKKCWVAPTASPGAKPSLVVRVSLGPNGRLRQEPELISVSNQSSVDGLPLVNSVKRALARCQPYSVLPAGKYQEWKLLDLGFSLEGIGDVGAPQNGGRRG